MTTSRLKGALAGYVILALISLAVLEGRFLWIILILFGGLALKSWVHYKKERLEEAEEPRDDSLVDVKEPD